MTSDEPYCGNSGYLLTGLTDSSKCPECGKPIVEILRRKSFGIAGKRYRSKATLFGWPVIDIALGPSHNEKRGHARGVIAIGDVATGGIALGGVARGIVAFGGLATGGFAFGGAAVGILGAVGGGAIATLAFGGSAIGFLAAGGGAFGAFAQGGGVFGLHFRDGNHFLSRGPSPFDRFNWFFGPWGTSVLRFFQPALIIFALALATAGLIGLIAWNRMRQEPDLPK